MEAIIQTGNKQYRVREGDTVAVEKVLGETVTLTPLLVTNGGEPVTAKSPKVTATVLGEVKADKLIVFKMKAKKRYRRKAGHRQKLSQLRIDSITA